MEFLFRAWKITQMVKCLLHNLEDWSLIPRAHIRSRVWWVVLVILTLGRKRQVISGAH